jgi:hypothetical protein
VFDATVQAAIRAEHGLFAERGAVAAPLDRVAHTVGCTNATRLGGRRELMSCGSDDPS